MATAARAPSLPAALRAAVQNAELAAATGAAPAEVIAAALGSLPAGSVGDTITALRRLQPTLQRFAEGGAPGVARRAARLEPRLERDPELARVRPDIHDHELRGKLLFRDLVGRKTFFQVAAWSIAGLELSTRDARLLEHLGVNTQLLDPHIWPLAVARRIASHGGPLARSVIGGVAALFTPKITVEPVGAFIRFLDETDAAVKAGATLDDVLEDVLRSGRRLPGFGRPVLGPDERVPHAWRLAKSHRRAGGPGVKLARSVERALKSRKGVVMNSAGVQAAIMRDMGFTADAAVAFCGIYFIVPLLAQHAFMRARER
ncbi:MAG TPA: citrate/2-methylcitrate synthase [Polyangiaceae bacterium]|jgi:hypothetical protein